MIFHKFVNQILKRLQPTSPEEIVHMAKQKKSGAGIAFTYNEPLMNFDFVLDTSKVGKSRLTSL
jgi:pyruvate formate lyase activating enzyme